MEMRKLEFAGAQEWDRLIAGYPGASIFHQRAWLEYLAASRGLEIGLWEIRQGAEVTGYFCGGLVRKGPFRILGSPLKGWGTNLMGPLMHAGADRRGFLKTLDQLASSYKLSMIEFEQRSFPEDPLVEAGYEYETAWTYHVDLTPDDPEVILKRMDKSRRYGIRRAIKLGLTVEDTDDPAMPDQYYDQFARLMQRKGMVPTYPQHYPRLCFQHLRRSNNLFALRVRNAHGQVIATGLFPHDENTVYFWGGASEPEARQLFANDLMHWHLINLARERGLRGYDMSGWGQFKAEFGGQLLTVKRWHKCYSRSARLGRRGYEFYVKERHRWQGWLKASRERLA